MQFSRNLHLFIYLFCIINTTNIIDALNHRLIIENIYNYDH